MNRLEQQLAFIYEIDKLKRVLRQSLLTDSSRQENSAEHSWHLAMVATVLSEYAIGPIDTPRVLKMVLVHDVVEIDAGDTFAYDVAGNGTKQEREQRAADRIFGLLPADQKNEFRELWEEFEAMATPEAQYANALDRLQPLLQNYHTKGYTWRSRGVHLDAVMKRMEPIRLYLPAIWPVVQRVIDGAVEAGYIRTA